MLTYQNMPSVPLVRRRLMGACIPLDLSTSFNCSKKNLWAGFGAGAGLMPACIRPVKDKEKLQ